MKLLVPWIAALCIFFPAGLTAAEDQRPAAKVVGIWWHLAEPWRPVGIKSIVVDHDASGQVLCFCENGDMHLVDAFLLKQGQKVAISIGDSGARFRGTWKINGPAGAMTYRLVDAGHSLVPVAVPGPEISRSFAFSGNRIRVDEDEFERTTSLLAETIKEFFPCFER